MDESKKTVNAILSVITITLIAKFLGFFRDAILGSKLGATVEADAYIMALNSTTIIFLSFGSAISTSAIPLIVKKLKDNGKKSVFDFTNKLINIILLTSVVAVIFGIIFAPQILSILAKGFYGEKRELVIQLTRIMFPSLIFISSAYLFVAFLQSLSKFIVPSIISFPFNIMLIIYLLFALNKYGIIGLAYATVIGWSLQLLIQIPFAVKEGYKYKLTLDYNDEDVKRFLISLLPIIFVASIHQFNILIDNMFASTLEHGKVASIYYANILYTAIVTTTVYGISAVMFPKFNQNLSPESMDNFKRLVLSVVRTVIYLLIPMTVGLIILSKPVISLVFERGEFNSLTTYDTSLALASYALGMVGFGVLDIVNKAFYALSNTKIPVGISIFVVLFNYFINRILLDLIGFKGLAIATSLSLIFGAILILYLFNRIVGGLDFLEVLKTLYKTVLASTLMGSGIYYFKSYISSILAPDVFINKFLIIGTSLLLGVLIFSISTVIMKEKTSIYIYESYIKDKLYPKNK